MAAAIKHLVVLMLENRSFDHMLGFMQSANYAIDGLDGSQLNRDSVGEPVKVNTEAGYSGDLPHDPSHDFEDVMEQMYGTKIPQAGQEPAMSGFVQNYERFTGDRVKAHTIMNCFAPDALPVLTKLASSYALCDRWYCSVPGSTLPNRVFVHAGTSRGRLDLSPDFIGGFHTVYEILHKNGVSSTIFYEDWSAALTFETLLLHNQAQFFAEYARFPELVKQNKLPSYCFIEPRYNPVDSNGITLPPNDQHPPDHDIAEGEMLIRTVYNDLRRNDDVWKSSLLVIVYDEHGGLYDHSVPPPCPSPDGIVCPSPPFDFTRLGPRVPALIISPYVTPGQIDHTVYDHTSAIATAMKLFVPQAWPSDVLGKRAQAANTFDTVLDLTMQPRMEFPNFAAPPAAPGVVADLAAAAAPAPLSALQRDAVAHASQLEQRLPPQLQTRTDVSTIKDENAAGAYLKQVSTNLKTYSDGVRSDANK